MKITATDLTTEPVTLIQAKQWLRIEEFNTDDLLVEGLIKSTRLHLEKFTGLSFGEKTITLILDTCELEFTLPYGPVNSVTSVEKWDGDEWTLLTADDDYHVIGDDLTTFIKGKYRIIYEAGYEELPDDLKTDIKVLVAWQYQNRGINFKADTNNQISEYPHHNLLNSRLYKKVVI